MNQLRICVAISCCSLLLAACDEESSVKKAVLANLKDPDSAKFGEITFKTLNRKTGDGKNIEGACVTVNSKNSMGGYSGNQQAVAMKGNDNWEVAEITDISHEMCIKVLARHNRG